MIFITKTGKEIQVPNDYTYMSMEKFAKECYQQGREDAIDEYFEKLQSVAFGNRKGLVHFKDIVAIKEQLKEQKNE